jgi:hypothetical protein
MEETEKAARKKETMNDYYRKDSLHSKWSESRTHSVYKNAHSSPERVLPSSEKRWDKERNRKDSHVHKKREPISEEDPYRAFSRSESDSEQKKSRHRHSNKEAHRRKHSKKDKDSSKESEEDVVWIEKSEATRETIPGPMPILVPSVEDKAGK